MARKLSRIARCGFCSVIVVAAAIATERASAQNGVRVSPTPTGVANPFAARRESPSGVRSGVAVPPDETGVPKTFVNPFANRSSSPQFVVPRMQPGSLSRWHRPAAPPESSTVELPRDRPEAASSPVDDHVDLVGPLTAEGERAALFAVPEDVGATHPGTSPPDPSHFGRAVLAQPTWLMPNEPGNETASYPVNISDAPSHTAVPGRIDPFDGAKSNEVIVSDEAPLPIARSLPKPQVQTADQWYAEAEQAATKANSTRELAAVVQLCQRGLAQRPPRDLAVALRSLAAWACNRCGELESDSHREDKALTAFELAIQWDPNCWLALHNRAVSRAQQGEMAGALADFNRALELNPGLAVAYRNRGELLAAGGRTDEAIADYTTALAQLPQDAELLAMRGHALHRLGRYEDALADFSQSIELQPHDAATYAHRGNVYAEMGEFARAIADFRQAISLDPNSADAQRSLAWLLATCPDAQFREPQRALAAAERAAKLAAPGDPYVLDALAAASAAAGKFEHAVRYQQEAIANLPDDSSQPLAARLALYKQGRPFRNGTASQNTNVRAASLEAAGPSAR